ncbi:MAG: hypothetical protein ABEJ83_04710 [Candidatus Nanohaloarchaea archaeon]
MPHVSRLEWGQSCIRADAGEGMDIEMRDIRIVFSPIKSETSQGFKIKNKTKIEAYELLDGYETGEKLHEDYIDVNFIEELDARKAMQIGERVYKRLKDHYSDPESLLQNTGGGQ